MLKDALFEDAPTEESWETYMNRRVRRSEYQIGVMWKAFYWLLALAVVEGIAIIVLAL